MLSSLPSVDGNKVLVVSEGVEATHADYLTIAWLQTIRNKNPRQSIIVFLFSYPKYRLDKLMKNSNLDNIDVQDYFSCQPKDSIDVFKEISFLANKHSDSVLVVNCLDTLALQVGPAKAMRFVEKLQQNHKSQIFVIHRRDFCKNIPRIETFGNTYVSLNKFSKITSEIEIHYQVSITRRKPGGSIVYSRELVCQNVENYNITSEKIVDNLALNETPKVLQVKPQASFRIEMNEQEMKQRDGVPLPYILSSSTDNKDSKIIYVPDDADDIDEEDPDDDLDI